MMRVMRWDMVVHGSVVVVRMQTNPVNRLNLALFDDLQRAFDRLDDEFADLPVVLTGAGRVFSAGVDFSTAFPMFRRGDPREIAAWFEQFRAAMLRVFEFRRPIVAAVNGHALAGGLVLALCCDFRVGVTGKHKCGLAEFPIGIPMPSMFHEIIRYRVGSQTALDALLGGRTCTPGEAVELGFYDELAAPDELIQRARQRALCVPAACLDSYAQLKTKLLYPTLLRISDWMVQGDAGWNGAAAAPSPSRAHACEVPGDRA